MAVLLGQPETENQQETWVQAEARGVDLHRLPRHIAVIMDGNGRWAKAMGKPRIFGHRAGAESVQELVTACRELGIEYVTLYAFSSENWKRPKLEVNALMVLLEEFLRKKIQEMRENGIRLNSIGHTHTLPMAAKRALREAEESTAQCDRPVLTLALSYGGRNEIVEAAKRLARRAQTGEIDPEAIDNETFAAELMTADMPEPDLLVRTSGEMRVSNFLLWQIAYSEIWITPVFWPDFGRDQLFEALVEYQRRDRRFGLVNER